MKPIERKRAFFDMNHFLNNPPNYVKSVKFGPGDDLKLFTIEIYGPPDTVYEAGVF